MLSYQHIYHAGNIADIQKHTLLSIILKDFVLRKKQISYFETHAGRGIYNLDSKESNKTKEYLYGIKSIEKTKTKLAMSEILKKIKKDYGNSFYPGSPMIAKYILRDSDIVNLCELHPKEYFYLKENFKTLNINCVNQNGYDYVYHKAIESKNIDVIFIDPSYEVKTEYNDVVDFSIALQKYIPNATIIIWYPILNQSYYIEMIEKLNKFFSKNTILNKTLMFQNHQPFAIKGSGVFIINCNEAIIEKINRESNNLYRFLCS